MTEDNNQQQNGITLSPTQRVFEQAELDDIIRLRVERATLSLAQSLGFDSVEALRKGIGVLTTERDAAIAANVELNETIATNEKQQVAQKRADVIKNHLSELNLHDNEAFVTLAGDELTAMFNDEGEFKEDEFKTLVSSFREKKPYLFKTQSGQKFDLTKTTNPLGGESKIAEATRAQLLKDLMG